MTHCPIHNRPLVRTHGGSLICIPCRTPERRERYKITWSNGTLATDNAKLFTNRESSRRSMAKRRAERRAAAKKG